MREVTESPRVPPPGQSLVLRIDAELCEGGPAELHGLVIEGSGRLAVANRGVGFRVALRAREWAYLAVVAARMAETEGRREIAANAQPLHGVEVAGHA